MRTKTIAQTGKHRENSAEMDAVNDRSARAVRCESQREEERPCSNGTWKRSVLTLAAFGGRHGRARDRHRLHASASSSMAQMSDDIAELRVQLATARAQFDAFVVDTRAKTAAARSTHNAVMAENKGAYSRSASRAAAVGRAFPRRADALHTQSKALHPSVRHGVTENLAKAQEAFQQVKVSEGTAAARTWGYRCAHAPAEPKRGPHGRGATERARPYTHQRPTKTAKRRFVWRESSACCARSATLRRTGAPSSRVRLKRSAPKCATSVKVRGRTDAPRGGGGTDRACLAPPWPLNAGR